MVVVNVFDAAKEGDYKRFKELYCGDANIINRFSHMNLLQLALIHEEKTEEKLKIIRFLLEAGVDVNYIDSKYKRNALHIFYFSVMRETPKYFMEVTKLLIESGININAKDKFGVIPLKYAISINKLPTEDIEDLYRYLIKSGSEYNHIDKFGKSCLDYSKEYNWRTGFISLVKEYEDGK